MTSKTRKNIAVRRSENMPAKEVLGSSPMQTLDSERFPSFDSLRAAHSELLKQFRQSNESLGMEAMIKAFVQKTKATGVLLDIENDRMAAQSLLDYWSTHLFRLGVETSETVLDEFDSSLAPDLPDSLCPYRGLNPFSEIDSGVFFGRQRLVGTLVDHLQQSRLLCVVGPSGSGKSSVVRAGLIPSLKNGSLNGSQDWVYIPIFMPGSKPLENLAHALNQSNPKEKAAEREIASLMAKDHHFLLTTATKSFISPVVVVVDQFEEVFTLCTDDEMRLAFVDNLVNLSQAPGVDHIVILTMRTDFESKVSLLPNFQPLFEKNLIRVMPLNASELRSAVEEPAKRIGLKFEEGVVDALLTDILGEPAALPLLQFTLLRLWDLRDHNRISWESFRRLGGARQALAKSADEFFNKLIPEEQTTARRILLRLVRPGEGLEITSNRLRRSDLYQKAEASDRIDRVLEKFIQARLLRLTHGENPADDQIEVAHEALVRNWPTLVNWLEEERINIRERQRLTAAADRWASLNRDQAALLRGVLLEEARQYEDLNELETAFLEASQAALDAEKAAEEAARQRELDDACRLAEESEARRKAEEERRKAEEARARDAEQANHQLNRRNRIITTVGIIALVAAVIAIIAGTSAMYSANQADLAREAALKSYNTAVVANVMLVGQNSTVVAANETAVAGATRVAYASTQENIQRATADAAKVTATQQQAVIVAATQTVVVQATAQAEAVLYAQQQSQLANTRLGDQAVSIAQSQPDLGLLLAAEAITGTVNFEGQAKLLDALRAQTRLQSYLRGSNSAVTQVAFTRSNGNLVSASEDGTIILWDTHKKTILRSFTLQGFAQLNSFAYNMASGLLAAAGCEVFDFSGRCTRGLIRLTTLDENAPSLDIPAHSDAITSVAFNPLGNLLVSGGEDGIVFVWNVPGLDSSQTEFTPLYTFNGHDGPVYHVAFNPRGTLLASTGADGKVLVRNLSSLQITTAYIVNSPIPIYSLAFTQNGTYLIFGRDDGALLVMDSTTGEIKTQVSQHATAVTAIVSSSNDKFIASASKDGSVILWNFDSLLMSQDVFAQSPGLLLSAHTGSVQALAFSPDSQTIASASRDKSVILWSTTESTPIIISSHTESSSIQSISFSPEKDTLWLAQQNGLLAEMNYSDAISGQTQDWEYASPARFYSRNITDPLFDANATLLALQTGSAASSRRVLGIDVSENTGKIDWQQIKREGYSFACLKATDGSNTIDGAFLTNWLELKESGLIRCAYHVFRINDSPEDQAKLFLSTVALQPGDLPPVLEVFELGSAASISIIRNIYSWMTAIEQATGMRPILRTSPNLWNKIISIDLAIDVTQEQPPQLGSYPLWVVDYKETSPDIPSGWSYWTFWQYTDQGRSTGSPTNFPLSRFNGNPASLQQFVSSKVSGSSSNILDTVSVIDALSEAKISADLPVQNATSFAFNADKSMLAIGLSNGTISIYNPKTAENLYPDLSFNTVPVTSLAFNPVKKELAAGFDDGRLIVIALDQDQPKVNWLSGHIGKVNSLAYTSQENRYGQLLASGGSDGNIFLWDMSVFRSAGQPLRAISGSAITALAFHPRLLILASGTPAGQILLWNIDPASWKELSCDRAARNLTEVEWSRYFSSQPYRTTCPAYPAAIFSSIAP